MLVSELREKFIKFFEKNGHIEVKSSSLIAKDSDSTVLFNIAGMQPFKSYFAFEKDAVKDLGSDKIVSCQKCIRTKDIYEVGDNSHLTFFEMLGNFSFGSYFKKEAIKLAYDFLFEELKLSQDDIYVTVFEGNSDIPFDEESYIL
ncbi:MAG: alanine--tRNA ligase-related protein [Candidatus Pacebacteria bacterium]|nr:alanine--tRNA ligase-related protein [Candidatus Paceibacterota bacterium]